MTGRKNQRETGKKNKREDCGSIALHYLEQYTRKNSLEIQGIPDQCYSTTEEVVLKLASVLNVNVNPTDIEISDKLKRRGNNSSLIIVKFLSHKVKMSLYKEKVKLRNVEVTDLFPGYSNAVSSDGNEMDS